jgi:hypothetical protein
VNETYFASELGCIPNFILNIVGKKVIPSCEVNFFFAEFAEYFNPAFEVSGVIAEGRLVEYLKIKY